MSILKVTRPYPYYFDQDGSPLDNGYVYIGVEDTDPIENPIEVYWDEGMCCAAPQPIRTLNGFAVNNGIQADLYVNSSYSVRVEDKAHVLISYIRNGWGTEGLAAANLTNGVTGAVGFVTKAELLAHTDTAHAATLDGSRWDYVATSIYADSGSTDPGLFISVAGTAGWERNVGWELHPNITTTGDNSVIIQQYLDHAALIGGGTVVLDNHTQIANQLKIDSSRWVKLKGGPEYTEITWIGATHDPVTEDDIDHSMILLEGTDHAFSGIENLHLNANKKANHCLAISGSVNNQVTIERIRFKWPQLDGLFVTTAATSGPVLMKLSNLSAFPNTIINGKDCVCGRSVFHFDLNSSSGAVHVTDCATDNGGTDGVFYITGTKTFSGTDFFFTNVKSEFWDAADFIVTKYASITTLGIIAIRGCKISSSGGDLLSLVHNKSTVNVRNIIDVNPFITHNAMNAIYVDDFDPTKNMDYHIRFNRQSFRINNNNPGILPVMSAIRPSNPPNGSYYYDPAEKDLVIYDGDVYFSYAKKGRRVLKLGSSRTLTEADNGKFITNGNAGGAISMTLPLLASVPDGFTVEFYSANANTLTVDRSGVDVIVSPISAVGTTLSSTTLGSKLTLVKQDGLRWVAYFTGAWS